MTTRVQQRPTVTVTDSRLRTDGVGELSVTLTSAPDGLAGFDLTVRFADSSIASATAATYSDRFAMTEAPDVSSDGDSVRLSAVDLEDTVTPGATGVPLGRIRVQGHAGGQTEVRITVHRLDDDAGDPIDPATEPGRVAVGTEISQTPTVTPAQLGYDLEGGSRQEVRIGDRRFFVISDVPGAASSRHAVTTPSFELVGPYETVDALWSVEYIHKPGLQRIFEAHLERSREQRDRMLYEEVALRLSELGLNFIEGIAYAMTGNIVKEVSVMVDTFTDAASLTESYIDNPHEEAFARMANSSKNLTWSKSTFDVVQSTAAMPAAAEGLLDAGVKVVDQLDTGKSTLDAWATFIRGIQNRNSPAAGFFHRGAVNQSAGIAFGFALGTTVDTVEDWFRQNAKIKSALHAYHTLRIPILQELIELEEKAQNAAMTPGDIFYYHVERYTLKQLRAITFDFTSMILESMAAEQEEGPSVTNPLAPVLRDVIEFIQDAAEQAATHNYIAENAARSAVVGFGGLGSGWQRANANLDASINMEAIEAAGGDQ